MNIGEIESGNIKIKVLTTNSTSITLLTDEKFKGKVIQPGTNANKVVGEHGLSMSIEVMEDGKSYLYLLDAGGLTQAIFENSKQLGVDLSQTQKLILTHGHFDHFGSLMGLIPLLKEGTEFILNPNCFEQNVVIAGKPGIKLPPAEELGEKLRELNKEGKLSLNKKLPLFNKNAVLAKLEEHNIKINQTNNSVELHHGIITSGEIELFNEKDVTKNLYIQKGRKEFEKHSFRDETAIYINIKDKGLVVLTGCGHCGIRNIIKHGQRLIGVEKIYAVIGGFHEEWNSKEEIQEKVDYFRDLNPEVICGMHCTGFMFNKLMSDHPSHTLGVVGTEFHF
jgi:7,8-dihydropterin-6-yl-methyl-4-(beta-D-ribofuranosyl)aminobenzene 5'-phosphate synthase